MNCLQVEGLRKTFPGELFKPSREILKGLDFKVQKGLITGFVGANGSGKTTTLKCVLGFIHASAGKVTYFDSDAKTQDFRHRIGFFPERPYLYEFLTAREFLKLHWDLSGGGEDFETHLKNVLQKVDLPNVTDRVLRSFSKGMLQRIGIAQAILRNPELLILDEPMSGLDPDGRLLMKDILRDLHRSGSTIFFSSHLLHDVEELCHELVMIEQGQMMYNGTLEELKKQFPGKTLEQIYRELKKTRSSK